MSLRAGNLNTYGTFRHEVEVGEGDYGTTTEWQDYVSAWGDLRSLSGDSYFAAKQANSEVEGILRIRYRTDIEPDMRVVIDGITYEIETMYDPDQRKEKLDIMLKGKTS